MTPIPPHRPMLFVDVDAEVAVSWNSSATYHIHNAHRNADGSVTVEPEVDVRTSYPLDEAGRIDMGRTPTVAEAAERAAEIIDDIEREIDEVLAGEFDL